MRYSRLLLAAGFAVGLAMSAHAGETMKIGHDAPPDAKGNVTHAYAAVLGAAFQAATNGEVEVQIFPNNQLGSSEERLQQVRNGIIQGTIASIGSLTPIYTDLDMLNLPFAFNDMAAVYDVFDGPFGTKLAQSIEKALGDVVVLAIADPGGFFALSNSKRPVYKLEDFKGLRIRTMTVPAHQKLIQSLGAEAYPLSWSEVYTGLQTGVIDGQMNPVPTIYRTKLYEVQSNTSMIKHLYNPMFFLVSKKFYDGLSETQQKQLMQASKEAVVATRGLGRISESVDLQDLAKKMKVNAVDPAELAKMRDVAVTSMNAYFDEKLSPEGKKLMELFKAEIKKANEKTYLR